MKALKQRIQDSIIPLQEYLRTLKSNLNKQLECSIELWTNYSLLLELLPITVLLAKGPQNTAEGRK